MYRRIDFMKKVIIYSQDNSGFDTEEIRNIIDSQEGVENSYDISDSLAPNIIGFDVHLDRDFIMELFNGTGDSAYFENEEDLDTYEQVEYISGAVIDNIRDYIETRYNFDSYHSTYDIYHIDMNSDVAVRIIFEFDDLQQQRQYKLVSQDGIELF